MAAKDTPSTAKAEEVPTSAKAVETQMSLRDECVEVVSEWIDSLEKQYMELPNDETGSTLNMARQALTLIKPPASHFQM